jgi:hypothetical protein
MDRRGFAAGLLVSLPFTLSVALLCTTSSADALYRHLSAGLLFAVFMVLFAIQAWCGLRAFRGAPLARPLTATTAAYLGGVFAVMLGGDVAVRLVKPGFLPAGAGGTIALWAAVLAPMVGMAALTAMTVAVGVHATRSNRRARRG